MNQFKNWATEIFLKMCMYHIFITRDGQIPESRSPSPESVHSATFFRVSVLESTMAENVEFFFSSTERRVLTRFFFLTCEIMKISDLVNSRTRPLELSRTGSDGHLSFCPILFITIYLKVMIVHSVEFLKFFFITN